MADIFTKEKRSEVMGRIRSKNTGLEEDARNMLEKHSIGYRSHPKMYGSPDFVLEGRLLLFCDSSFWHGRNWESLKARLAAGNNPDYWVRHIGKNRERDGEVNDELARRGHVVLRLWDTDIRKRPEWCVARIREALDSCPDGSLDVSRQPSAGKR